MKVLLVIASVLLFACSNENKTPQATITTMPSQNTDKSQNTAKAVEDTTTLTSPPAVPPVRHPAGIYQFIVPYNNKIQIQHTVSFPGNTYRLQERFRLSKKDSVKITTGTWAVSDGFIWLHKDQVIQGRYAWKGDTLQYFSPKYNRLFSMQKLTPVLNNAVLRNKKSEGTAFYGVGTEPFWSVELTKRDTLIFSNPEWTAPLKLKRMNTHRTGDSLIYTAGSDSSALKVIILSYFCSDGMSDFVYNNEVHIYFNGIVYKGCGIRYR